MGKLFVLVLGLLSVGTKSFPVPPFLRAAFPTNEYEYSVQRDSLLNAENAFEGHTTTLNSNESVVNNYLEYLKWREFQATKDLAYAPSRPIEEMLDYIRTTDVYRVLKKLPKGGNMHSHEDHEVSKRKLLEIVFASPDFEYFYMLPPNHPTDPWKLEFYVNPPITNPPWIKVKGSNYTLDIILEQQTLMGVLTQYASRYPTDSGERWREINPLWMRGSTQLVANINIKAKYLEEMFAHGFDEGIIYWESRKNFGLPERLYTMDPSGANSATNGKLYLDQYGDLDVQVAMEVAANFTKLHPEFIGHRRISYTHRMGDINGTFKTEMENVARLHQKYPDHVLGFDAVGEEDAGNSLLYYVERFLTAGSQLPLYLHTTETSWPDDFINSANPEDPVSTAQNAIDTLLLLAKRLGHATGFVKHPYRMELVRQQGIAIEACVVSNQILGYIPDLRQHPALIYYRSGIPIVLGADDPGTMGYDDFTVDWYQVYSAWGLDLSDLKTLALNSLSYSSMSPADKTIAIEQKWLPLWTQYIADLKTEACSYDFTSAALGPPSFGRILPREGANSGSTKVHIYGRNFETSICKSPKCRFGSAETPATYVDNTHLICDSPSPPDTSERTVSVAVALDGISFVETGELFTYKYSPIVVPQLR